MGETEVSRVRGSAKPHLQYFAHSGLLSDEPVNTQQPLAGLRVSPSELYALDWTPEQAF